MLIDHLRQQAELSVNPSHRADVTEVLTKYPALFELSQGLPPSRAQDHQIHLLPGAKPVNVKPYRYPYFQKQEIERQVRDMLSDGVIRQSTSPFSSPVLLVKKKDGTWRFCVVGNP